MGILLCEKNVWTFGVEMRACGQKLVKFCTLTHAAKLVRILHCKVTHTLLAIEVNFSYCVDINLTEEIGQK